ncbi:zinc finger protein 226-like, partial [Frankliniella occidentalis]|uniref:Zinc finger protein 226-like n=1 Tax=Frankliniella occidentalis TaxID=133901 RepID=A0A9C6XBM0_FRAOC
AASETGTSEPGRITQTRISRTSRKTQKGPEVQDGDSLSAAEPPLDGAARTRGEHAQHGADRGQQDAAGEAPHRCATCGAAFRRAALLRAHMRTHAADKLDSGEHCGVSPASTLIGDRPFNCQTCGQRFTYSSNLRVHMRTHTGDRPFNCQTCG